MEKRLILYHIPTIMKAIFLLFTAVAFVRCNAPEEKKNEADVPQPATMAAAEIAVPNETPTLTGKKWVLKELFGSAVGEVNNQVPFIEFDSTGTRVSAFAGCNRMNGSYTIEEDIKITFGPMMATKMACPDMSVEDKLAQVLQQADNFYLSNDTLKLHKAKMAPLAMFVAE